MPVSRIWPLKFGAPHSQQRQTLLSPCKSIRSLATRTRSKQLCRRLPTAKGASFNLPHDLLAPGLPLSKHGGSASRALSVAACCPSLIFWRPSCPGICLCFAYSDQQKHPPMADVTFVCSCGCLIVSPTRCSKCLLRSVEARGLTGALPAERADFLGLEWMLDLALGLELWGISNVSL